MKKLYEISHEMCQFQELVDQGEIDEETKRDTLEAIQLTFDKKATNVALMMKNIAVPITAIDNEIKRLTAHKKAVQNKVQWFKNYLKENMETAGIDVVEDALVKIRLQKSQAKLEITCEIDELPEKYRRTKIEIVAKTELIKTTLKAGKSIEGCKMTQGKHIRIY